MAAFAQGKVKVVNDGGSPFTLSSGNVLSADSSVAGQAIATSGPLPSGEVLQIGLYWGITSSSLALAIVDPTSPNPGAALLNPAGGGSGVPGVMNADQIKITGNAGGSPVFMQVKIWDSAYASYEAEVAAKGTSDYLGQSAIFQMTPGTGITYPSILNGGGSTWTAVGNESPIVVSALVPEPATFALAGLGAAALLIFRRRK